MGPEGAVGRGGGGTSHVLPFSVKGLDEQLLRRNKGARNKDSEPPENHREKLSHIQQCLINRNTHPCRQISPKMELSLPD